MGSRHAAIQRFQLDVLNRNSAHFREYLDIIEELGEQFLWGIEHLPRRATGNDADKHSSIRTVLFRLFNDFEVAKMCILRGFPDQCRAHLRDAIECCMLIRLFEADRNSAIRWLTTANEYWPGTVYARLTELKIPVPEYSMYSLDSDRSHANVIASIANVKETDYGGRSSVEWGVGGYDNPDVTRLRLTETSLRFLFAMHTPLSKFFEPHLGDDLHEWQERLSEIVNRMSLLIPEDGSDDEVVPQRMSKAVARIGKKYGKAKTRLLAEMRKLLGADFEFPAQGWF